MSSSKGFASTGDMTEKKISFTEVGPDLFAFTAEGDPNTGVIVGDDCCAVFDAQATPAMAGQVIERVRTVTDKPIKYVILSHYHAVRVLALRLISRGLSRHKRPTGLLANGGSRIGIPNSAGFRACSATPRASRASLGRRCRSKGDDALPWQARSQAHAARRGSHLRRHRGVGTGRGRHVHGRPHRVSLRVLLRRRAFTRLAAYAQRDPRFQSRSNRAWTRRRARNRQNTVLEALAMTRDFVLHALRRSRDDGGKGTNP